MAHFFITGTTGTLGSYIAKKLLKDGHKLTLLIRAKNDQHLELRLNSLLDFTGIDVSKCNVNAYCGDITLNGLGLSEKQQEHIFSDIDYVIHSAASVHLNMPVEQAIKISLDGTKNLIEVCKKWGFSRRLKKITYLSTVGVGGKTVKELPEQIIESEIDFHNSYELSKALTEKYLLEEINNNMPISICRPSMIVGDTVNGKILSFQVFYYILDFLSGKPTHGILPQLGSRNLDIINVDVVSNAISLISQDIKTNGHVFNICSGPKYALSLVNLEKMIRQYCQTNKIKLPITNIHFPLKLIKMITNLGIKILPEKSGRQLKPIPHFLSYLETKQSFSNTKTCNYLTSNGVSFPDPRKSLNKVFKFYFDSRSR